MPSVGQALRGGVRARGPARSEMSIGGRRWCDLLVAAVAVLGVSSPMLFTESGLNGDFTNHLWASWAAGNSLVAAGHPSYFLNATQVGVFYPWFAFYGGSLYMIVGSFSELLGGDPILAYVGASALAVAGSYLGMMWLGQELGLRGWASHAPAVAVVTSAYYITNLYGRGAWTEFMGTAVIAPLLASGVHLVRSRRWRPWPVFVFVVSAVIFTGSHNITLLWGSTVAVAAGITLWLALGAPLGLPVRRLAMVAGLGAASVAINAWYLIPDIGYAQDVRAHLYALPFAQASFLDTPQVLLDPLRTVPAASSTPGLFVQIPEWFLVWSLLVGALLLARRGAGGRLRRAWVGVLLLFGVLLGMIIDTPLWRVMPSPFDLIQYPYRLGTYVFYSIGVLVLLAALALQRTAGTRGAGRTIRLLRLGLVGVCAVSIGLCGWQLWIAKSLTAGAYANRTEALASVTSVPRTWYDPGSYNDDEGPIVIAPEERLLVIDPSQVHGDRFSAWMRVPPGLAPIQTNIAGGPYLVQISGLTRVGRNPSGYAVVQREREGSGPVHVVVQTTHSTLITLARAISILGCLAVFAIFAWTCANGVRARREALA